MGEFVNDHVAEACRDGHRGGHPDAETAGKRKAENECQPDQRGGDRDEGCLDPGGDPPIRLEIDLRARAIPWRKDVLVADHAITVLCCAETDVGSDRARSHGWSSVLLVLALKMTGYRATAATPEIPPAAAPPAQESVMA